MQEENITTYRGFRVDDTAEWHLTVYMSEKGMSAYLKNVENPLEQVVTLFSENWKSDDRNLLDNIENAVYDHPQLLDDFSTDVVVAAPRCLWIPAEVADGREELAAEYRKIYPSSEDDIFFDAVGDMRCVYTLAPGLPSFMRRTLSGARIRSLQGLLVSRFMENVADMPRLYVNIRDDEADMLLFDGKKLLLASTHPWREQTDLLYNVLNIMEVYKLDSGNTKVSLSGLKEVKTDFMKELRKYVTYVMLTTLPSGFSKSDIPLGAALVMSRLSQRSE